MQGGAANASTASTRGGNVTIVGGRARIGVGGDVSFSSGASLSGSSGSVRVASYSATTAN